MTKRRRHPQYLWGIPNFRKNELYGQPLTERRPILGRLVLEKVGQVVDGKLRADHVQVVVWIRPKCSVAQVVGDGKGKTATRVAGAALFRQ
jgi:REP element-mobilizing transposase RayT